MRHHVTLPIFSILLIVFVYTEKIKKGYENQLFSSLLVFSRNYLNRKKEAPWI